MFLIFNGKTIKYTRSVVSVHVPHVTCHLSCVRYNMSGVIYSSFFFFFFLDKVLELVWEGLLSTGSTLSILIDINIMQTLWSGLTSCK